jgi:hypothetical protein
MARVERGYPIDDSVTESLAALGAEHREGVVVLDREPPASSTLGSVSRFRRRAPASARADGKLRVSSGRQEPLRSRVAIDAHGMAWPDRTMFSLKATSPMPVLTADYTHAQTG